MFYLIFVNFGIIFIIFIKIIKLLYINIFLNIIVKKNDFNIYLF